MAGIRALLAAGAAPNAAANSRCLSPLGEAVAAGHAAAAAALLDNGADSACRAGGYSLLHIAGGLGRAAVLQLLLDAPISAALLNDASNTDGATPLHAAALAGSTACVELLLARGADAGAVSTDSSLPWQLVPAAELELAKRLRDAAAAATSTPHRPPPHAFDSKHQQQQHQQQESCNSNDPVASYTESFAALTPREQRRKVETLARLPDAELAALDFLAAPARAAISQVSVLLCVCCAADI